MPALTVAALAAGALVLNSCQYTGGPIVIPAPGPPPPGGILITHFDPAPNLGPVLDGSTTTLGLGTIQVTNLGGVATTAISDTFTGQDASQFSIASDNCVGKILAVGVTCTVGVIFAPTLPGDLTSNFTVSAANSVSASVAVSGTGNALTIDPPTGSSLDYGFVPLGTSSPPRIFTVTNHSSTPVNPVISPLAGGLFTVSSETCSRTTLAPGAACSIAVVFTPSLTGKVYAALSAGTTLGDTTTALLSGTGGIFIIFPTTKDYGTVTVGSSSAPTTFTATNMGSTALSSVTTSISSGFNITSDGCTGTTVAPAASCSVVVTFGPTQLYGPSSGELELIASSLIVGQALLFGTGGYLSL
jgi:hypothetical protein